jgi:hypothetical protein
VPVFNLTRVLRKMITLKNLILILFAGSIIFACSNNKEDLEISLDELIVQGNAINVSTLTKEQKKSYKRLVEVVATNLKVDGDKIVFIGKDKFVSEGFTGSLYDRFINDINTLNVSLSQDSAFRKVILHKLPVQMEKLRTEIEQW